MDRMYKHIETGSVDTRQGWIDSYSDDELEARGLPAEQAFAEDDGTTLIEVVMTFDGDYVEKNTLGNVFMKFYRETAIAYFGIDAVEELDEVAYFGIDAVEELDEVDCDYTNSTRTDGQIEYAASIECVDMDGTARKLIAYYYQDKDEHDAVEGDGSLLDWDIDHYEIG